MIATLARTVLSACLISAALSQPFAQDASPRAEAMELFGTGVQLHVTRSVLAALPRVEQKVTLQTSKSRFEARFEGVLLWDLIKRAGGLSGSGAHPELQRTFIVTGRDGYAIAFSMGEISPEFGNRAIMLADKADGEPLPARDGLRLIVPNDNRAARSVRDVASIELR